MRPCRHALLPGLTLLTVLAAWQTAALDVSIRNFAVESGSAYSWQVTSTLQSPQNVTLYGNETAKATFNVVAKRLSAGTGYIISGRVVLKNPDDEGPLPVESVRLLLGPGLPLFGPTPKTLDCKPRTLEPGSTMSCAFKLQFSNTATKTVTPSVQFGSRRSFTGDAMVFEYPAAATGGGNCATITDRVVAGDSAQGITASGATGAASALLGSGVELCNDTASWTYTAQLGPFGALDICGQQEFKNSPVVTVAGFGSSTVRPAVGNLFISGCRQKDALGLLKPGISISKLTLGNLANSSWSVTTNSSSVTPGTALNAVPYDTTITVKSVIHINKTTSSTIGGLVGEITVVNNQVVPYVIAGVRVVITPNATVATGVTATGLASATPQQIILDAKCPLTSQGTIVIPPQLISTMPGVLKCAFTLPVDSSLRAGTVQAQLKTLFSPTYEVDSGLPTPYHFASNTSAADNPSACVEVWAQRITDASQVSAADMDVNQDLATVLDSLSEPGVVLAAAPKRVVSGRVPPTPGSLLAIPYQVCGNKSIEWTEMYGPFSPDSCGLSKAVTSVYVKPAEDRSSAVNTAVAIPLTIKGCGVVPTVSVEELLLTAKKVYTWNVETTQLTPSLTVSYDQREIVQYNISYTREQAITGRKIQGLVKVINPLNQPVNIQRVTYTVSRPDGQAPLTGTAVCNESFAGAAQAALEFAATTAFANIGPPAAEGLGVTPGPRNAVTSFSLPAAPAIINTPQLAAPPPPPKAPSRLRFFNMDISVSRGAKNTALTAEDDSQDEFNMFFGSDTPVQSGPEPYYCSFVVNTPDDHASEVSVGVVTDKSEETQAVAPYKLDWSLATSYESGRCAMASSFFKQTQPESLLVPEATVGTKPPEPSEPVRICEPTTFSFQALYGPFSEDLCGNKQALIYAGVSVPGLQNLTNDISMTQIAISGCPGAMPMVTMGPATAAQVTAVYDWSIERTMRPLGAADNTAVVSVSAANARMAAAKALQMKGTKGSVALFNQTITFRRSSPTAKPSAQYQVKGSVSLLNPTDKPMLLKEIQVKLVQATPVVVKATCPSSVMKPAPNGKGTVISVPPSAGKTAGQSVSCSFTATTTDSSKLSVVASAVMPDGRWAKASNAVSLDLLAVKPIALGSCIKIHESQNLTDVATKQSIPQQAAMVGSKVPATAEELCSTKSFQAIGQIGPLQGSSSSGNARMAADTVCGGVLYDSVVIAQPTNGPQGKLTSTGSILVSVTGC